MSCKCDQAFQQLILSYETELGKSLFGLLYLVLIDHRTFAEQGDKASCDHVVCIEGISGISSNFGWGTWHSGTMNIFFVFGYNWCMVSAALGLKKEVESAECVDGEKIVLQKAMLHV